MSVLYRCHFSLPRQSTNRQLARDNIARDYAENIKQETSIRKHQSGNIKENINQRTLITKNVDKETLVRKHDAKNPRK